MSGPDLQSATVTLATAIRREHKAAQTCASDAVAHARRCGELLLQAKAASGHGHFMKWVEINAPEISQWTAQAYMRTARLDKQILDGVKHLSLRKALAGMPTVKKPAKKPSASKPKKVDNVTKAGDLLAKRIIKELESIKPGEIANIDWFIRQLVVQTGRLNPNRMFLSMKGNSK